LSKYWLKIQHTNLKHLTQVPQPPQSTIPPSSEAVNCLSPVENGNTNNPVGDTAHKVLWKHTFNLPDFSKMSELLFIWVSYTADAFRASLEATYTL